MKKPSPNTHIQIQSLNCKTKPQREDSLKKKVAEGHLQKDKSKAPTTRQSPDYNSKPQQEDSLKKKVAAGHREKDKSEDPHTNPEPQLQDKAPTRRFIEKEGGRRPPSKRQVQRPADKSKAPTTRLSPDYNTKPQ